MSACGKNGKSKCEHNSLFVAKYCVKANLVVSDTHLFFSTSKQKRMFDMSPSNYRQDQWLSDWRRMTRKRSKITKYTERDVLGRTNNDHKVKHVPTSYIDVLAFVYRSTMSGIGNQRNQKDENLTERKKPILKREIYGKRKRSTTITRWADIIVYRWRKNEKFTIILLKWNEIEKSWRFFSVKMRLTINPSRKKNIHTTDQQTKIANIFGFK